MIPALSVAIPAHNEERHIAKCIQSIRVSARAAARPVEIVVALNRCTDATRGIAASLGARCIVEDRKCSAAVRNAAVRASTAPAVATLDADSWMSQGTVGEVLSLVDDRRYVGGGTVSTPGSSNLRLPSSSRPEAWRPTASSARTALRGRQACGRLTSRNGRNSCFAL